MPLTVRKSQKTGFVDVSQQCLTDSRVCFGFTLVRTQQNLLDQFLKADPPDASDKVRRVFVFRFSFCFGLPVPSGSLLCCVPPFRYPSCSSGVYYPSTGNGRRRCVGCCHVISVGRDATKAALAERHRYRRRRTTVIDGCSLVRFCFRLPKLLLSNIGVHIHRLRNFNS